MNYESMFDYLKMVRDEAEDQIKYAKRINEDEDDLEFWLSKIKTINEIIDAVRYCRDQHQ